MATRQTGKKRRVRLHEATAENDIRYRGPLSYQHFQTLGWLCIVVSMVLNVMRLIGKVNSDYAAETAATASVLEYIAGMSLPFLLIANFSRILNNSEGYSKQLIRNGGAAAGIFAAVVFVFSRYVVGAAGKLVTDPENVLPVLTELFRSYNRAGFIAVNIFVDLFLCTLFMFFLNTRPKRVFTGKKVLVLRVLALLPIACEAVSLILKYRAAQGQIQLPLWSFPLLAVKPPMTFAVFVMLAIHMKIREFRYCRHGRTHEEYQAFLQTNRNSRHFSIFLAVILVFAALADLLILAFLTAHDAPSAEAIVNAETQQIMEFARVGISIGFGESVVLLFLAPVVLLFSYTRMPKNKKISTLIPAVGIVLIIAVIIEGTYQLLGYLPAGKFSIRQAIEILQQIPVQ